MPHSDLLPSLLFKINENQLALEAAIMELTFWAEKREATEVGGNVRGGLEAIERNEEFIKMTLAVMMTPEWFSSRTERSIRAPHPIAFRREFSHSRTR